MRFVLDASVALTWLLRDSDDGGAAFALVESLARPDTEIRVPATWNLEIANVIARAEIRGQITEAESGAFLDLLTRAPIEVDPATAEVALSATLALARRYRLSSYDASYLELACREGLPLATLDGDLAVAARTAGVALVLDAPAGARISSGVRIP
jgi:predicted nucleic acid-binding protein